MTNNPEELSEEEAVKAALDLLRSEKVSYTNNSIYGAAILLSSYFEENLSLEEALNEFIDNTDLEISSNPEVIRND